MAGSFTYSVGAPSPGGPPTAADPGGDAGPAIRAAFPVVRWIGYVGLLLLVGAVLILAVLWPAPGPHRSHAGHLARGRAVAVATIGELVLQVPYVAGAELGDLGAPTFGRCWPARTAPPT